MVDFMVFNEVYVEYFSVEYFVCIMIEIFKLLMDVLVEIEIIVEVVV